MASPSQPGQAGDIEITSEMIVAGVYALDGFNWELDSALEAVAEVYRAMEIERRCSNPDAFDSGNSGGTVRANL